MKHMMSAGGKGFAVDEGDWARETIKRGKKRKKTRRIDAFHWAARIIIIIMK